MHARTLTLITAPLIMITAPLIILQPLAATAAPLPQNSVLLLTLRSDLYAGHGANARIGLNGKAVSTVTSSTQWRTAKVKLPRKLAPGDELQVLFDNDAAGTVNGTPQDRNLRISTISVDGRRIPLTQAIFDAGSTWASATDGLRTSATSGTLFNNGALRVKPIASPTTAPAPSTSPRPAPLQKPTPTALPTATSTPKPTPMPTNSPTPIPTLAPVTPVAPEQASSSAAPTVDQKATAFTLQLFTHLQAQMGSGVMFGHHEDLTQGAVAGQDPWSLTRSDTKAATGHYPAVIGWDAVSLTGHENLGVWGGTPEESAPLIGAAMAKADSYGSINTLSWHAPNFVTGGQAQDTTGDVVGQILPDGAKNAEFRRYLDAIATAATDARRPDSSAIPIIFRPWHESNGDWFWWSKATSKQKIALWRYTVTYLRDTRQVHNLLYAWSPSGGFWGDEKAYLKEYPGDDFVDILGLDSYDNSMAWDDTSLQGTMKDLTMISSQAIARKKVAAFTEFGPGTAFKPSGNPDPTWFTTFLAALKANPSAARIAYALTWSNWQSDTIYVPSPGTGANASDLLADFQKFAADPMIILGGE